MGVPLREGRWPKRRGWAGRTLDDQVRPEDTHGGDTDAGLGGAVGGAEAGEDDGGHAAHRSEERLSCHVSICPMRHRVIFP